MSSSLTLPRRKHLLALLALVFIPCAIYVFVSEPDLKLQEQLLTERLAELQVKLEYLDGMLHSQEIDVHGMEQQVPLPGEDWLDNSTDSKLFYSTLKNASSVSALNPPLKLPSVYQFLTHLVNVPHLRPAYITSKGRRGVKIILGVPTVKRSNQSYLLTTLQNLLESMSPEEQNETLIVVLIAEVDAKYVISVANDVKAQFPEAIESGLIDIISPPLHYYPEFSSLRRTLDDDPERVKWRSKQNLDYAFLMMYAQSRGMFYVQLEDDILAKTNFITTMKSVALKAIVRRQNWFVLDFCQLGFIGKMFKCFELPWIIQFFIMFFNDKPCDWLLENIIHTKVCRLDDDDKKCKKRKAKIWVQYEPSLFQHIGTTSSLKGKIQTLKDKRFGKLQLYKSHSNPSAECYTTVKAYKIHTLQKAYLGESFFWGLTPQPNDVFMFKFKVPIRLKRYLLRSGNAEHPSDLLSNTTVEIFPVKSSISTNPSNTSIVIGKFNNKGIAEGTVPLEVGPVDELRLTVHSESDHWVILSEILIETDNR
ncbi:unnamed protein product [Bemisia tabaci]|uniref:Alpha-1,3-mannosyl-glycoprotein 4-beta-N-acetylglucosaminyltransferase B n=1 Tax=Bemisia tabaci TaxID=7038 RepID=A0A9P0EZ95_BEMTA|nr:PREDICTED: alpha-1,3-mannosyl-glycoprotein 4-beta-N-acetylglucosaminyltransferase B [Bemisia tabaci]CAH0383069.1 unnamed protein product [Bemisia tabaci]